MNDWSMLKKLIWLHMVTGGSPGTVTTVTGTSPLALANALAKPIKSLIQYGKVTTVDGEMFCNNGKLVAVDDELPSGYKRLLGITFDGNIRYETGEALTGDDDVTMTLDNLSASGKNVFGSYNGANDKNFSMYIYGSSTSGSYFRYGDQLKRPKYGGTGRRTITFGASGTSGFAEDSTVDPDEFTTPANTYIGMLPNSSSAAYTGDIVGSILVSNRLEWIPTERETDGVIGYYEKYNGNFISPTGSGTPVSLGYDTSHLTVLSVGGTPEVLTLTGVNLLDVSTAEIGIAWNGSVNPARARLVVPIKRNAQYILTMNGTNSLDGVFSVLSTTVPPSTPSVRTFPYSFNSGENDYLVLGFNKTAISQSDLDALKLQLEPGSTATTYEPYTSQTASVVNLFSTGTVHDEQDIISGVVTRKTEVSVVGGVIAVSALAEPVTEHVTAQHLRTVAGDNTVSVTSNVDPVDLAVTYMANA